jgi:hypothetical protein
MAPIQKFHGKYHGTPIGDLQDEELWKRRDKSLESNIQVCPTF